MEPRPRLLNVGGGPAGIAVPPWYAGFEHLRLDIDPAARPDILCDARRLDILPGGGFDAIYCSHNLEHYHAHEVAQVLAGFLHMLKPDGFAEIRVPDLEAVARIWVERGMDIEDTLYTSPMGPVRLRDVFYGYGPQIERSGQDFYAHRTGFTQRSLAGALTAAGFHTIVRRPGRAFELHVAAFRAAPGTRQRATLGLRLAPS